MADLSQLSDRELIHHILQGEIEAFEELMARHTAKAFQIAYGVLGNRHDAEEVTQDAFVRIFRALPSFRGESEFSTWMYRIVVNQAKNRYRWNKRRGSDKNIPITENIAEIEEHPHMISNIADKEDAIPDRQIVYQEWQTEIARHIEKLPEIHREVLILRNVQSLSYEQIAEILGCKVGTIKSRIARAREELRKRLLEDT